MSTMLAPVVQTNSWLRPKYALFGLVGMMLAYVVFHNESFVIHAKDPAWQHYQPFKWWLLPHAIAGSCALMLGPMQFSDRLRQRYAKLHRVMGRIYVGAVFVAGPLGLYIQYFNERVGAPRSFSVAAGSQAVLWMITTGIAMTFILQGKVQLHRQWMTRSFAVALVFLEVRVIAGLTGWENRGLDVTEAIVWGCIAFSIIAADILLQLQELRPRPAVVAKRIAVTR